MSNANAAAAASVVSSAEAPPLPEAAPAPSSNSVGETLYSTPPEAAAAPEAPAPVAEVPAEAPVEVTLEGTVTPPASDSDSTSDPVPLTLDSYTITLPDGMAEAPAITKAFKELALESQIKPEAAQKLVDTYVSALTEQRTHDLKALQTQFAETQTKWSAEVNTRPEFQGEARSRSLATIGRAIDEFSPNPANLREALNLTGAGNNPHLVDFILSMAKGLVEGMPTPSGGPPSSKVSKTLGQRLGYKDTSN